MLYFSCTLSRQDTSAVTQSSEYQTSKFDLVTQTLFHSQRTETSTCREFFISSCWGLAWGQTDCPRGVTGFHQPLQDKPQVTSSTLDLSNILNWAWQLLKQKGPPKTVEDRMLTPICRAEGFRLVPVKKTKYATCTRCIWVTSLAKFIVSYLPVSL